MRFTHGVAVAGFLASATFGRAESAVPLNYLDDFGSRSPAFTTDGYPASTVDLDRDRIASVNGPDAAGIESSGARMTATSPAPALDREWVASVNGPNSAEFAPSSATTEVARR